MGTAMILFVFAMTVVVVLFVFCIMNKLFSIRKKFTGLEDGETIDMWQMWKDILFTDKTEINEEDYIKKRRKKE